jgi:hypothetical protein
MFSYLEGSCRHVVPCEVSRGRLRPCGFTTFVTRERSVFVCVCGGDAV